MTKELTKKEIEQLIVEQNAKSGSLDYLAILVLVVNALLAKHSGCSPEEKREAERVAYLKGESDRCYINWAKDDRGVDHRYPSLKPAPPTVMLSNGQHYRRMARRWYAAAECRDLWVPMNCMSDCKTADDFAKCEDLMRTEEARQ